MKDKNAQCGCGSGRKYKNCHRRIEHRARKEEEARKSKIYEDLFNDERRRKLCDLVNEHLAEAFGFHPVELRPTNPLKDSRHRSAEKKMKEWADRNGCRKLSWPSSSDQDNAIDFLVRYPFAIPTPWAPDTVMVLPDELAMKILVLDFCPC